jgi:hypothetical protein
MHLLMYLIFLISVRILALQNISFKNQLLFSGRVTIALCNFIWFISIKIAI